MNFKKPKSIGQLDATETQYNITCPSPTNRLMYLDDKGAKFSMAILVEKTDRYTVEFWFKANVEKFPKISESDVTYLFMMEGAAVDENAASNLA